MMKRSTYELVEQFIFYLIIFLILREWLVPIMMLTNTGYFTSFLIFILICLALGLLKAPIFVSWPLKLAYITWFIVSVYSDGTLTARQFLSRELKYNVDVLMAGDWVLVSDPFRTSLFFILLWMLIYLIRYWLTVRLTIYYFLVLTVFFIATLDTFTAYDGTLAIIKVMILGLVMTSMLFIKRLMQATNMQKDWTSYIVFATPIIVFVTVVGLVAALLPKAEPQWPDPVPYVKGLAGIGGSGTSISTVGYGDNDENLGGPFIGDSTLVYEIETPIRQYWRVETKDFYTSKGWVHSGDSSSERIFQFSDGPVTLPLSIMPGSGDVEQVEVRSFDEQPFLLQAYGVKDYLFEGSVDGLNFNESNEKIKSLINFEEQASENYRFLYQQPEYSFTQLKESVNSTQTEARYLQLPNELPRRVIDLAYEITDSYDSVYDKARAIEDYFKRSGFQYETTDVQIPKDNEDYVDQFLFETKLGYCDNFSTSMVVLLRSVGIQARWVKGFSSGERISSQDGIHTYEVTNNDAHSWVEAYIDGIGWMPFEPTIGFSNPVNIDYDVDLSENQPEQLPEADDENVPEVEEQPENDDLATGSTSSAVDLSKYKWLLYVLGGAFVIALIVLWKKRGKWQPKLIIQINRSKLKDEATFEDGYFILLKQLERIHLKRRQDETLQQFAQRVDGQLQTTKMSDLTAVYEQIIYAGGSSNFDAAKMKEIWEYLINRTIS